jgi:hypothetical protein
MQGKKSAKNESTNGKNGKNGSRAGNGVKSAPGNKRSIDRAAERARQAVAGPEGPALRDAEKGGKRGPLSAKRAPSR